MSELAVKELRAKTLRGKGRKEEREQIFLT